MSSATGVHAERHGVVQRPRKLRRLRFSSVNSEAQRLNEGLSPQLVTNLFCPSALEGKSSVPDQQPVFDS
jgi:hypothetical protein